MAETTYTYSLASDFPNNAVAVPQLTVEIQGSTITTALAHINTEGDSVGIVFKNALSSGDETILDGLIAAHLGVDLTAEPQIRPEDGTPYNVSTMFPLGIVPQHAGAGDDVDDGDRYVGPSLRISSSAIEERSLEWQFIDPVYFGGGLVSSAGQVPADYATMITKAPATAGVANPGAGGFDKVAHGAGNRFVPNASETGDWHIDLDETLNASVDFTKAVPVPNSARTGKFNYNPLTNQLSVNVSGTGAYDIFDYQVEIFRHLARIPLATLPLTVPAVSAVLMLPQWVHRMHINHTSTEQLEVAWVMYIGRAV